MTLIEHSTDSLNPVNTQTWSNGRHLVHCVKVIRETHDVKTFCFMSQSPIMFFFKPGQFVTLELNINDEQVMRSYTISSSPSVPYSFSITVKRVNNGLVSNWLHDNLKEDDELAVHGPVGGFNAIDHAAEKVLLLSGGVGITPVMSMARWWFDTNSKVDIKFVHNAQSPKDIIYRQELEFIDSRIDNFSLGIICDAQDNGESWYGYRGYLNQQMLELLSPDYMDRTVFCCGPTPYMAAVKKMLIQLNFPMENYHEESFGTTSDEVLINAEESAELALAEELDTDKEFFIEFVNQGLSIKLTADETISTAGAKLRLHIPKACGMGICGTCKVRLVSGQVEMEHTGGITEEDEAEGYILSCCSKPKSHVVIDI
ncbi:hybrid-cluster NAD(P)-dependent oxidoreductase [Shewanella sp. VB17]|uniref:hybrid-cluster NAD(P)-dependent oxidoreductase n=1 Tax=Shewanella sp. VB17 TaxID=2739432 RepID=UPI0028157396|nr:hybrid-cluster NAD(P)-dependent oxidoreductase [Shewanella sp. VB17]